MPFGIDADHGFLVLKKNCGGMPEILSLFLIHHDLPVCLAGKVNDRKGESLWHWSWFCLLNDLCVLTGDAQTKKEEREG